MKQKLEAIAERGKSNFFVRIDKGGALLTGYGKTIDSALKVLEKEIEAYKQNEGSEDKFWSKVNVSQIEWTVVYDIEAFFTNFAIVKQSTIASMAKINPSLVRQYASGSKYPSATQASKIQAAIHQLAMNLKAVKLYGTTKTVGKGTKKVIKKAPSKTSRKLIPHTKSLA